MVDAAGSRHSDPVFIQDRHMRSPHVVQMGRHVVVLAVVAPLTADQTTQALSKALLCDLLRYLIP